MSVGVFAEPAPDGLLIGGGTAIPLEIFDPSGEAVAEVPLAGGSASHDAVYDDGSVVAISWDLEVDTERVTFAVERVNVATGAPSFVWRATEAEATGELAASESLDPWHANGLAVVADGTFWVSLRALDALLHVDPFAPPGATIIDRFGAGGDIVAAPGEAFHGQHDPELVGSQMVLVDNGTLNTRPSSRAVAYALPSGDDQVAIVTRSYTEPGWFEPVMGASTVAIGSSPGRIAPTAPIRKPERRSSESTPTRARSPGGRRRSTRSR